MTVRPKTLTERFQVFVDFTGGSNGVLVNTYKDMKLAEKCCASLNADVPTSFVDRAWWIDTEGEWVDRLVSGA